MQRYSLHTCAWGGSLTVGERAGAQLVAGFFSKSKLEGIARRHMSSASMALVMRSPRSSGDAFSRI